jgi:phage shock protein C
MFCTQCGQSLEADLNFCPRCGISLNGATPRPEKKLLRPLKGNWLAGVCNGFAQYFAIDVTVVRLAWLATLLLAGTGLLAYLICWFVIPRESFPPNG